jgi:hypothetical protein
MFNISSTLLCYINAFDIKTRPILILMINYVCVENLTKKHRNWLFSVHFSLNELRN